VRTEKPTLALLVTFGLVAVAALSAPSAARSEGGPPQTAARYVGTYRYAKALGHGRAIVDRAFDDGLRQLNPILRAMARSQMTSVEPLVRTITIALPGDRISVRFAAGRTATFVSHPGAAERIRTPRGREVVLTQRFRGGRLEQHFVGPRSRQRNVMTLSPDGQALQLDATIESRQLQRPIEVRLDYVREPS
jgi:hypothetical protein